MNLQENLGIPATDWTKVSACCDGGRCVPVQKPATSAGVLAHSDVQLSEADAQQIQSAMENGTARPKTLGPPASPRIVKEKQPAIPYNDSPQPVRQLEPQSPQPPTIEECEEVAARLVKAQRDWNNLRKKPHDLVKQPAHYTFASIEPIVAINAWDLSYNLGCVVKYIVRAKHKGTELLDLEKAAEYLRREIEFRTATH